MHLQGPWAARLRRSSAADARRKAQLATPQNPVATLPHPSPIWLPCAVSSKSSYDLITRKAHAQQSLRCMITRINSLPLLLAEKGVLERP